MNRLRHDDFLTLFHSMGWDALDIMVKTDTKSQSLLREGKISLDNRFKEKSTDILSITRSILIFQKNN
jgi:hypothetical protein